MKSYFALCSVYTEKNLLNKNQSSSQLMLKTTYIETHLCIPWPEKAMQLGMCGIGRTVVHANISGLIY